MAVNVSVPVQPPAIHPVTPVIQAGVTSEIGRLRRVLIHRPGDELRRLTPANKDELLFDGTPWCERAQEEHDEFAELLRGHGVAVHYLRDLLADVLRIPPARAGLVRAALDPSRLGETLCRHVTARLGELSAAELADALIGGITMSELGAADGAVVARISDPRDFAIVPLPNHLFMRDSSAWIGERPHVGAMALGPRRRETAHLAAIYRRHPMFGGGESALLHRGPLEGGDLFVLREDRVLVGVGSRSGAAAAERLALQLLTRAPSARVLVALLPRSRATIHLDAVLTMVDRDVFTLHRPVVEAMPIYRLDRGPHGLRVREEPGLVDALAHALDTGHLRWVETGGDAFAREREQWDEANNVLALAPGTVVAYDRNVATNERLSAAGVEVLTISGSELSQGRGGPRCLSCPVHRGPV